MRRRKLLASLLMCLSPEMWAVGDSITFGYSSGREPDYVELLAEAFPHTHVRKIACPGATSTNAIAQTNTGLCHTGDWSNLFPVWIRPRVLIWFFGTNDPMGRWGRSRIEADEFMDNLDTAIGRYRPDFTVVVLPPRFLAVRSTHIAETIRQSYEDEMMANRPPWTEVVYLDDILEPEDMEPLWWTLRGVHPLGSGHAKIAAQVEVLLEGKIR